MFNSIENNDKIDNMVDHCIPVRENFAEIYDTMLGSVVHHPHYVCQPRNLKIKERLNESYALIDPTQNLFKNEVRSIPLKYIAGELIWYFSGDNRIENIVDYSSFWDNIKNPDGTLNSAYGDLIFKRKNEHGFSQWQWAHMSLVKDKDSRQALMYFGRPDFQYQSNKDFVCTCFAQFFIRDNHLSMHVTMRSNDIIKGTTFDVPFFTLLQQNMYLLLKEEYPELQLGNYVHNAMSLHLYEDNFKLAEDMLQTEFVSSSTPPMIKPLVDERGNFLGLDERDELGNWILENSKL